MKIGYFLGKASLDLGGAAPYALRVIEALSDAKLEGDMELEVIQSPRQDFFSKPDWNDADPSVVRLFRSIRRRSVDSFRVLTRPGSIDERLNRQNQNAPDPRLAAFDLLHVPYQTPPTYDVPFICTMHDVQELHFPEHFSAAERENRAIHYRKALEQSERIVVSFEHVKEDLVKYFHCSREKIRVIPIPYRNCSLKTLTSREADAACSRFARFSPFFLYPAQTWAHKNHLSLIEAFEIAASNLGHPVNLVCTGRKNEYFEVIEKRIQESKYANAIIFTGIVPEGELRWLYENSLGVVIPTLYEAGSFPLIEAMFLGAPVICANTTSLPDTIGNQEFVFEPRNIDDMASMMTRLASDARFRAENLRNSNERIEEMRQVNVAQHYVDLWSELLQEIRA